MTKKEKRILKGVAVLGAALALIEAANRAIFCVMKKKAALPVQDGEYHNWKHGRFFYKKKEGGSGRPLLLIHDLYPDKSAEDMETLACCLAEKRTVYTLDLLGCGRSDKPACTYTNFLYVLQVTEMIEKVIKQPVHLVARGRSAEIAVAACHYKPEYFSRITLLDRPEDRDEKKTPDSKSRVYKKLIELPIFGTLLYNMTFIKCPGAYMGGPSARYLYASIVGHYTNFDTRRMEKDLKVPLQTI